MNSSCKNCSLYQTAKHVCLGGEGPIPCDIMIVGEAPGFREDDTGRPFQGKAGEILNGLLKDVGFDRKNLYVTNVIRCRPPNNRTPTKKEIVACNPYLQKEIKVVKPKFILVL